MPIQVIPYTAEWVPAVLAFNDRMHRTGTHWGWFGDSVDAWLPARDKKTWREHWLAVEDGALVRGAYALKPHEWRILGEPRLVVDWQGPITEALIDRRWSTLGLRLLREMLKQYPLLYSWGHGGLEQPMLQILGKLGWLLHHTPFLLRVLRPFRFLRLNGQLRDTRARRVALDAAAFSGAGSLGLRALHTARTFGHRRTPPAHAIPFERFEGWADEVWERCAPLYAALACRDADTMNTLLPPDRWPHGIPVRVERDARTLGWAVLLDTRMQGDARFGDLRVGSVIDCLAAPEDAEAVVGAALRCLRERGVDLVVSNQSHPAWIAGFGAHGFEAIANRRVFAASPGLHAALAPFEQVQRGLHLTNMDGHGPAGL